MKNKKAVGNVHFLPPRHSWYGMLIIPAKNSKKRCKWIDYNPPSVISVADDNTIISFTTIYKR